MHIYDPKTKERIWSSTNVSNFKSDKQSSKADEFTIKHDAAKDAYTITARPNADVQVSVTVTRAPDVPGWKLGGAPRSGRSLFGANLDKPDGYVVHRFWPLTRAVGHIVHKGRAITIDGTGMLVHAIQGMRPNLVASRWNFTHFQSPAHGGVTAIMMEFTTTREFGVAGKDKGNVVVNIGSVVVGGKLATVTGETRLPGQPDSEEGVVTSRARHLAPVKDKDTGYIAPSSIEYIWKGPSLLPGPKDVSAKLVIDVGPPTAPNGLIQKVDVLSEIPGPVKGVVNYVTGVKPYIYQARCVHTDICNLMLTLTAQWVNPAKLTVRAEGLIEGDEVTVEGWANNEATFISEP